MSKESIDLRIRVNRAPVLTLWAVVVAERVGHPRETALSLASCVAGTAAQAKARRLALSDENRRKDGIPSAVPRDTARLLGTDVPLTQDAEGQVLADAGDGKPAPAAPVDAYLARAFGRHLSVATAAMEGLAARYDPEELSRVGFRLYVAFRPDVPTDVTGWGAKGELDLEKVRQASALGDSLHRR